MGNLRCPWATVDLHQLHWQGVESMELMKLCYSASLRVQLCSDFLYSATYMFVSFQILVRCQEVYCRKTCPMPLNISTAGGNKLVITQIAEEGIQDIHVPYASAAVLPGPTCSVDEDIHREPVIVQTPSPCLLQSYEDVGQAAFGDSGRAFITAVLYTELIGTCALFFILEASPTVLMFVAVLALPHLPTV